MIRAAPARTTNGRFGSFATSKNASPFSRSTRRSVSVTATRIPLSVLSVTVDPSCMGTASTRPTAVRYEESCGQPIHPKPIAVVRSTAAAAEGSTLRGASMPGRAVTPALAAAKRVARYSVTASIAGCRNAHSSGADAPDRWLKKGECDHCPSPGTAPAGSPAASALSRPVSRHAVSSRRKATRCAVDADSQALSPASSASFQSSRSRRASQAAATCSICLWFLIPNFAYPDVANRARCRAWCRHTLPLITHDPRRSRFHSPPTQ